MSVVTRFAPASLTAQQYDDSISRIQEAGDFPPDGLDYHVCFGADGNLRVSEIWDSREQFERSVSASYRCSPRPASIRANRR